MSRRLRRPTQGRQGRSGAFSFFREFHFTVFSSQKPTHKHPINQLICHLRYNLANRPRNNKRSNCYESLPEEEQLSYPPIREAARIRSVCNKRMCSKCLQIPLNHSHIWRRALNCTCGPLKSCFWLNDVLLWPEHDTSYRGAKGQAMELLKPYKKWQLVEAGGKFYLLDVLNPLSMLVLSALQVQLALCSWKLDKKWRPWHEDRRDAGWCHVHGW